MKTKISIFIISLATLLLSSCQDKLTLEPEEEVKSRALVSEAYNESWTNPTLLSDWQSVDEIVLNSTNGSAPLTVTPPWCEGASTILSDNFCNDIKKGDGWTMLFHTFRKSNQDIKQSYMCFYNLFTGIVKVFFYYEGNVTATNSYWRFGVNKDYPNRGGKNV